MSVPTFVDLQGFLVEKRFVAKEVAVLRRGTVLSHYIFESPLPWKCLTRSDRSCASWLIVYHHGLKWEDGAIPYSKAKHLIATAVFGAARENEEKDNVYVKGPEKREWLRALLDERERANIETLDADYENVDSLSELDAAGTVRCGYHNAHCALQNVFKLYNWWLHNRK